MKVLHVIDGVGVGGGAEESLVGMLPLLRSRGIDGVVACLYHRDGHEERLRSQGFRVEVLGAANLVGQAVKIRQLVRELQPDLVHASLIDACFATRLAMVGLSTPQLNSLVNTTYDPVRLADLGIAPWKMWILRAGDSLTSRWVSGGFHVLTEAVKAEATDILHIPANRVRTIPRGRDSAELGTRSPERRARVRAALGVAPDQLMILNVGRQDPQKGKTVLVKAFDIVVQRFPQALLFIAGREAKDTANLRAAADASPVRHRIHVLGHRSDVSDLLAAADLFVFPSFYEGLGGALVEALAMGCPIVGSDAPAVAEVLGHGRYGRVVPRGDVKSLATVVQEMLESPEERAVLAARGRQRFEERFELAAVVDEMAELYRALASGPPRRTMISRFASRVKHHRRILTNRLVLLESGPGNNAEEGRLPDSPLSYAVATTLSEYKTLFTNHRGKPNKFAAERLERGSTFLALIRDDTIVSSSWISAPGVRFLFPEIGRNHQLANSERMLFDLETLKAERGKGYGKCVTRLAQALFSQSHLLTYVLHENAASLRVFEQCGFRRVREARRYSPNPLSTARRTRRG